MILYKRGGKHFFHRIGQLGGSVFPCALLVATPCAACTAILRFVIDLGYIESMSHEDSVLRNSACWSGFTFLVGFLIVFRTSQAYSRFWDGCTATHEMRAQWFQACSSLVAFCRYSNAPQELHLNFQHLLVRLFSMLHAAAMAEIEDNHTERLDAVEAFRYELLDPSAVDTDSLRTIMQCDSKVELLIQWIQQHIVDNLSSGVLSIPSPLIARPFQDRRSFVLLLKTDALAKRIVELREEVASGVVAFHHAMKISSIPFPFPYAQTCDILLLMHWVITPLVTCQWVSTAWWGAVFSFAQVCIYWCLNLIAMELENPFGKDPNDLDGGVMQEEMNRQLRLLLEPTTFRVPRLVQATRSLSRESFMDVWTAAAEAQEADEGGNDIKTTTQSLRYKRYCRKITRQKSKHTLNWAQMNNKPVLELQNPSSPTAKAHENPSESGHHPAHGNARGAATSPGGGPAKGAATSLGCSPARRGADAEVPGSGAAEAAGKAGTLASRTSSAEANDELLSIPDEAAYASAIAEGRGRRKRTCYGGKPERKMPDFIPISFHTTCGGENTPSPRPPVVEDDRVQRQSYLPPRAAGNEQSGDLWTAWSMMMRGFVGAQPPSGP